jgi:hypothetical protein
METKFNFKSQICTTREQSERLLSLGLKKETADCCYLWRWESDSHFLYANSWEDIHISTSDIPAWSLHRLIEILDTNPFVFYTNCGYDTVIDHVEEYIRSGFIDTRYLEDWCLNEEE